MRGMYFGVKLTQVGNWNDVINVLFLHEQLSQKCEDVAVIRAFHFPLSESVIQNFCCWTTIKNGRQQKKKKTIQERNKC